MDSTLKTLQSSKFAGQRGAVIALVALLMVVFVGLAALVVDMSHLYVVRNELQNAADAGALAGARFLFKDAGTSINKGANKIAYNAAIANKALSTKGATDVEVHWAPDSNDENSIARGHWSFGLDPDSLAKGFTANDSDVVVELFGKTTEELDADPNFINAVKVVTKRENTPASSFFAKIFGFQDFALSAEAVAYIGFAGGLRPQDVDQPIAICMQSIDYDDSETCHTGRMINSGEGQSNNNTAAWTNFTQNECSNPTPNGTGGQDPVPGVNDLICANGNPDSLNFGTGMGTAPGMQDLVYRNLIDCWKAYAGPVDWRGYPTEPWTVTLPVVDCPGNNVSNCAEMVGAVTVDFIWIKESGTDPHWEDVPVKMGGVRFDAYGSPILDTNGDPIPWECDEWVDAGRPELVDPLFSDLDLAVAASKRQACFQEFADEFSLETFDETPVSTMTASDIQKTMYFKPNCEVHGPRGVTGGDNFGIRAEIPVLVQ